METKEFDLTLRREENYRMSVAFDMEGVPDLLMDEPEPLGDGAGPNAARALAAAIGNCLSASLLFCLSKTPARVGDVETKVHVELERNEKGRWRVGSVRAAIRPTLEDGADARGVKRCLDLFEDFCIVTASVRDGIDVDVEVDFQEA